MLTIIDKYSNKTYVNNHVKTKHMLAIIDKYSTKHMLH